MALLRPASIMKNNDTHILIVGQTVTNIVHYNTFTERNLPIKLKTAYFAPLKVLKS